MVIKTLYSHVCFLSSVSMVILVLSLFFPIVCACISSILWLRSASIALCVAVRYRYPIPSGNCSLDTVFPLLVYTRSFVMVLSVSLVFAVYLVSYVPSNRKQHTWF